MSDIEEFDLDSAVAEAWEKFEGRLAIQLLLLDDGDFVVFNVDAVNDDGGVARYVQLASEDAQLQLEVSSNAYLTDRHRLTPAEERALAELGLTRLAGNDTSDNEFVAGGPSLNWTRHALVEDDGHLELAALAVAALRDVFGVVHPAFAHSDQLEDDHQDEDSAATLTAVIPTGWPHLRQLVDDALEPVFGQPPIHDEDDDIPVIGDGAVAFVRVQRQSPIVEVFTTVVVDVQNHDAAQFEVGVLNRDSTFVRYVLADANVTAHLCLPASPFVPDHLRDMLAVFSTVTEGIADDLAHRVGGRHPFDDDEPG